MVANALRNHMMTMKRGRISVIVSDSAHHSALCAQLTEMGQDVVPVHGETAAFDILRRRPMDMVFCDIEIKEVTAGLLVFHILREIPQVWLVATCRAGDEGLLVEVAAALEAGAKDFVTTPVSRAELGRVLRAALG